MVSVKPTTALFVGLLMTVPFVFVVPEAEADSLPAVALGFYSSNYGPIFPDGVGVAPPLVYDIVVNAVIDHKQSIDGSGWYTLWPLDCSGSPGQEYVDQDTIFPLHAVIYAEDLTPGAVTCEFELSGPTLDTTGRVIAVTQLEIITCDAGLPVCQ